MYTITHIAGVALTIGDMVIQRCSLCGGILVDNRNTSSPDGSKTLTWGVSRLVRVHIGNPIHWELLEDTDKLPEDSCIDLI